MKRFVTYIYQYDRGIRGKNVGFVKVDIRDAGCRMEIQIRGLERFQGRGKLYIAVSGEDALAIPAGELLFSQGAGHAKMMFADNQLGDSGFTVDQIQAVLIRYGGGKLLASCWSEHVPEALLYGQFAVWEAPAAESEEEAPLENTLEEPPLKNTMEETPAEMPMEYLHHTKTGDDTLKEHSDDTGIRDDVTTEYSDAPKTVDLVPVEYSDDSETTDDISMEYSDNTEPMDEEATPIKETDSAITGDFSRADASYIPKVLMSLPDDNRTAAPQVSYERIEITDIRKLPKRNWYLCNNSFLIHGFFNYHYLMLKTIETDGTKKCYLGIPGIYEQPERMMALLFGFPEFEPETASDASAEVGTFGYWMCQLDLTPNPE